MDTPPLPSDVVVVVDPLSSTMAATTTTTTTIDHLVELKEIEQQQPIQIQNNNNNNILLYPDSPDISISNGGSSSLSSGIRSINSNDNYLIDSPKHTLSYDSLTTTTSSSNPIINQNNNNNNNNSNQDSTLFYSTSKNQDTSHPSSSSSKSKHNQPIELTPTSSDISSPSPPPTRKKSRKSHRKSSRHHHNTPKFHIKTLLQVSLIQMVIGLALIFPLVIGILWKHIALLMYGGYGVLLTLSSMISIYGLLRSRVLSLRIFYWWNVLSIILVIVGTVAIGLMGHYDYIDLVKNWGSSITIITFIGVIAIVWSIACIVWTVPLISEMEEIGSNRLAETETEEKEIRTIVNDTQDLEKLTQIAKPKYGEALPENPIIIAIRKFNKDPDKALNYLKTQQDIVPDLINFLHQEDGLDKKRIGELLGGNSPEKKDILYKYMEHFNFVGKEIDEALRELLTKFRLPGEAQQIDKIMECFASKYTRDNPNVFGDPNTAYILAFSIILLNTDAHNPNIVNKMDKKAFIRNCDFRKDKKFEPGYLSSIYNRIVHNEIKMDKETLSNNAVYKGWLFKVSSKGKRQHKRWFVVKNNCLYYFKNSQDINEDSPSGIIPLESLTVKKLSQDSFMIEDPELNQIKSVKITKMGPVQGHSIFLILKCMKAKYNDLDKWIDTIRSNMLGDPVLMLIKKKKLLLERANAFEEENGYNPLEHSLNPNQHVSGFSDGDDHPLNSAVLN